MTAKAQPASQNTKPGRIHPTILLATANLHAFATLDEVMAVSRRSRSFLMELIADGELVALQNKPGRKGSRLLVSTDSLRGWMQRSLVHHD
jgi:hypothetical protein